ncbi:MAG: Brp/Blh family beta-carotene 15,15'-dioxygenase, partial [Pricia sp.]
MKSEYETVLGFMLILSFGILHGSNDVFLITKIRTSKVSASFWGILSFYVLFVLSTCGIFYFFPIAALSIFVAGSGYHFGEQHWENDSLSVNGTLKRLFYVFYGMFILSLLFWLNSEEVIKIVGTISGSAISKTAIAHLFYMNL